MEPKKRKRIYKKGMTLIHQDTHEKILFGKHNDDGTATCLNSKKMFVTISREDLDANYISVSEQERLARQRRSGQAW